MILNKFFKYFTRKRIQREKFACKFRTIRLRFKIKNKGYEKFTKQNI